MPIAMIDISPEELERRLDHHPYLSPNQARTIYKMINERFAPGASELERFRQLWRNARSHGDVDKIFADLRQVPTLAEQARSARAAARANAPTEEGFYRNPDTGELFRLKRNPSGTLIVSKYSKTAVKRLTVDDEIVTKGVWKKYTTYDSNRARLYGEVKSEWLTDAEELKDYRYGFCSFCNRGLSQPESVVRNYGEDCSKIHGLPYGGLADAIAARRKKS